VNGTVSIVVPTRNGAATLPALLDGIAAQTVDAHVEVVAVDSGSTDGTADLLRGRVDRFLAIPPRAFDHGATRNAGVAAASGDLVVLLVQDAVPADERWLAALIAPLRDDRTIAGAFARQRARPDACALTRRYLSNWIAAGDAPRVAAIDGTAEFARLSPRERLDRCAFDNVCSCIRRSVWRAHPFRPAPIAEDLEWARDVLVAGHRLAFVPAAVVVHSHERDVRYEFDRTLQVHRRLRDLFGLRTIETLPALGRAVASSAALHLRCRREDGRPSLARALGLAVAWPLAQYLGGRSPAGPSAGAQPETA
jgi:rhamnosyltransferase